MEFLRFGSSIPGGYWGCCSCCIIQNFNFDPDEKASIQLVYGDAGSPVMGENREFLFAGPTYRDIFWQRLRVGTFDSRDMPDHAFLAILTREQLNNGTGRKWLAILKEAGFEFIRTVDNSVYSGQSLLEGEPNTSDEGGCCSCGDPDCDFGDEGDGNYPNYIFGMFRNIGTGAILDPFTPPKEWTDLPKVVPEPSQMIGQNSGVTQELARTQREAQRKIWDAMPRPPFLNEKTVREAGATPILAGLRTEFPPETKEARDAKKAKKEQAVVAKPSAFPVAQ